MPASCPSSAPPAPEASRRTGAPRSRRIALVLAGAAVVLAASTGCVSEDGPGEPTTGLSASANAATAAQPAPTESLLTQSPDAHSEVGALADGFPLDLLPLPEGAEVLVSSAKQVGDTDVWDVSLNLRSPQDTAALVEGFRQPLLAAGFTESAPDAAEAQAGLAAQTTFARGDGTEILVLGVLDRDGVRTLTLGGRVRVTP